MRRGLAALIGAAVLALAMAAGFWVAAWAVLVIGLVAGALALAGHRWLPWVLLAAPFALGAVAVSAAELMPPCEDFLDGPCETNWLTETAAVAFGAAVLSVVPAATVAFAWAFGGRRRA